LIHDGRAPAILIEVIGTRPETGLIDPLLTGGALLGCEVSLDILACGRLADLVAVSAIEQRGIAGLTAAGTDPEERGFV